MRAAVAILCIALTGCAIEQQHQQQQQFDTQKQAFDTKAAREHDFFAKQKPLMDSGKLKKSVYYAELYQLLDRPPVSGVDRIYMNGVLRMQAASRQLEAGQINAQQFDAVRRDVNVQSQEDTAKLQAREQEEANGKQ